MSATSKPQRPVTPAHFNSILRTCNGQERRQPCFRRRRVATSIATLQGNLEQIWLVPFLIFPNPCSYDFLDQHVRQRLVGRELDGTLGSPMPCQLFCKLIQNSRPGGKQAAVVLECRISHQHPAILEHGDAVADHFGGFFGDNCANHRSNVLQATAGGFGDVCEVFVYGLCFFGFHCCTPERQAIRPAGCLRHKSSVCGDSRPRLSAERSSAALPNSVSPVCACAPLPIPARLCAVASPPGSRPEIRPSATLLPGSRHSTPSSPPSRRPRLRSSRSFPGPLR